MKKLMRMGGVSGLVVLAAAAALLGACNDEAPVVGPSSEVSTGPMPRAGLRAQDRALVYEIAGGAEAHSRVERTLRADGSEVLRGRTEIGGPRGAKVRAIAIEEVEIDAQGRLVSADVSLVSGAEGSEVKKRVHLDPAKGLVRIAGPRGTSSWRAPTDAPWAYAPLTADGLPAMPIATPVAAWVTLRAVGAAPSARVIDCDGPWTSLIPADQLVVEDGAARFVVLGDDAIEANQDFIVSMQLNSLAREAPPRAIGFKLAQASPPSRRR